MPRDKAPEPINTGKNISPEFAEKREALLLLIAKLNGQYDASKKSRNSFELDNLISDIKRRLKTLKEDYVALPPGKPITPFTLTPPEELKDQLINSTEFQQTFIDASASGNFQPVDDLWAQIEEKLKI